MVRRAIGSSTEFSNGVARVIEQLRERARLSSVELSAAADMSSNYYYKRIRGEAPFNTNDIEKLAGALEIDLAELLASVFTGESDSSAVVLDGVEIRRRLDALIESSALTAWTDDGVVALLTSRGVESADLHWHALRAGEGVVRVPAVVITTLADAFDVPEAYLHAVVPDSTVARVEAQLELQRSLRDSGARAISARALDEVSPDALRAIASAIRSIDSQADQR